MIKHKEALEVVSKLKGLFPVSEYIAGKPNPQRHSIYVVEDYVKQQENFSKRVLGAVSIAVDLSVSGFDKETIIKEVFSNMLSEFY